MAKELRDEIAALEKSLPELAPEQAELIERAARELSLSGIAGRVLKVGEPAPEFTLPDAVGRPVSLAGVLATGPVVVTFYRGMW